MKFYLPLITLLLTSISLFSQEQDINQKYWEYRNRLFGDGTNANPGFVAVESDFCPSGNCAGYNIVIDHRNKYKHSWDCQYDVKSIEKPELNSAFPACGYCYRPDLWAVNTSQPIDHNKDKGVIAVGDGTIILGNYFALLATEWAMFNKSGISTLDTERKIFLALQTLERLDTTAEKLYGKEPKLDGFFIRSDMPTDFGLESGGNHFGDDYNMVDGCTKRLAKNPCDGDYDPALIVWSAMSQDQVIGLLYGFRFLEEYLPNNLVYTCPKTKRKMNLSEQTKLMTDLIVSYVRADKWLIYDPNGDYVCRGRNVNAYNWPMAKAANIITGKKYQTFSSAFTGKIIWRRLERVYKTDNIFTKNDGDVNRSMVFKLAAITGSWSNETLGSSCEKHGFELYDLSQAVLFSQPISTSKSELEEMLNVAPVDGPHYYNHSTTNKGDNKLGNEGWRASNRFSSPNAAITGGETEGDYNGLDYMLLHNLYCLYYDIDMPHKN